MIKKSMNRLRDKVFNRIHSNYLIYNTCWEDPKIDRQLMQIGKDSKIVMITSAGCNALDYLLDKPTEIHCIDMNPRQNSVMALKQALFKYASYDELSSMFMAGRYKNAATLYQIKLRTHLPAYAVEFWDQKITKYFFDENPKKTYYYHGTSGMFAWMFRKYFRQNPKLKKHIEDLFASKTLEEQAFHFGKVEPKLMNKFLVWLVNRHITMSLLGVPASQRKMVRTEYPGGLAGFLSANMRNAFSKAPVQENYFYYVYLRGFYNPDCCPNYLLPENFEYYRANVDKIKLYCTTFSQFLKDNPGKYTHFVLLDHQDWLASYSKELLDEEWRLILENSAPGARILMRSAAIDVDFIPDFVRQRVTFQKEQTESLHPYDRVGTYASVQLMIVK